MVKPQKELQVQFSGVGFTLWKWKTNKPNPLEHVVSQLKDQQPCLERKGEQMFTKVLGLKQNADLDAFHPTVVNCILLMKGTTRRSLLSNISHVDYVRDWCSPATIKPNIITTTVGRKGRLGLGCPLVHIQCFPQHCNYRAPHPV